MLIKWFFNDFGHHERSCSIASPQCPSPCPVYFPLAPLPRGPARGKHGDERVAEQKGGKKEKKNHNLPFTSPTWGSLPTPRALLLCRGKHGVGRIDIVENRFVGMKSRGEWSLTPKCHPSHKSSQKKGENAGGTSQMLSIAGVLRCRPHWQPSSAAFPSGFGGYEDFLLFFYEGSCPLAASAMVCASPGVPVPPETPRLGVAPGPGGKPPRLGLGG